MLGQTKEPNLLLLGIGILLILILGGALIFSLAGIAILGFFPQVGAEEGRDVQSEAYWRGEAVPFQILEHSCSGSKITMMIQNAELSRVNLKRMRVGNSETLVDSTFAGGELKTLTADAACGSAGSVYRFDIVFAYTTPEVNDEQTEMGLKPLVGKAS